MSVAAALAEAHHHSAPKVGAAPYNAPRSQKTARASGKHPGVPKEPEAATVGYVAASTPLLVVASLAGGDEVDATTTRYLLKCALRKRQKEEEEERRRKEWEEEDRSAREALERAQRIIDGGSSLSSSSGKRRKKKKRRKRKLPKSSSGVLVRRCGQGFRSCSSLSGARGCSLPCSSWLSQAQDAPHHGRCGPEGQLVRSGLVFPGDDAPRAVLLLVLFRPWMLDIMAGMDQKDSYAVFAGDDAPRAVPSRFHRCSSWTISWPVVCNDRCSGPGAVLGQVLTCPLLQTVQRTVELPLLQFFDGG